MIKRLTIIGVGLIGGSLARALKMADCVGHIIGCGLEESVLKKAMELDVIDGYQLDIAKAVKNADIVLLAVPVGSMESVFRQMKAHIDGNTVITDVGSSKRSVVNAAENAFGEIPANFVPAHPIAGTEKSGVDASFAELFQNRRIILTPLAHTNRDAVSKVRDMWESIGANVSELDVDHHDSVLAATSHLPHLLAFSLVDTLASMDEKDEIFQYAAGGFRDFTRIASSDPQMWHDICVNNRNAILEILKIFQNDLEKLKSAIAENKSDYILNLFTRAKRSRDQFYEK